MILTRHACSLAYRKAHWRHCVPFTLLLPDVFSPDGMYMHAGHSLGGALATLCAFDVAAAIKEAGARAAGGKAIDVSCYTFGAPRTGNRAFCHEFNALVPNCWGIINDQVWGGIKPYMATRQDLAP